MKERMSNVIAWVGFVSFLVGVCSVSVHFWYESLEKPERVLFATCKEFDTVEHRDANPFWSEEAEKLISKGQLERCKSDRKFIAMWEYKGVAIVLTGHGFQITLLQEVDHLFDGFTYISTYDLMNFYGPLTLSLWLISVVLNYIFFGAARLLPWKKVVVSE